MSFYLHGIGVATPPHSISQEEACEIAKRYGPSDADQERRLRALYRLTGVGRRHSILLEPTDTGGGMEIPFFRPRRGEGDRGPTTRERLALYEQAAPPLAARAGRAALADAGWTPADVSHVVTVSCTGFAAPSDAHVAVHYRNQWFWIDDRDKLTKQIFNFIMFMFSLTETGSTQAAPIVTVPAR